MGTVDYYGAIHIKRRQTTKENIAKANSQCEWTLTLNCLKWSLPQLYVMPRRLPTTCECLVYCGLCSGGSRISRVGGGGRGLPRQLCFEILYVETKKSGPLEGGSARHAPPHPPMLWVYLHYVSMGGRFYVQNQKPFGSLLTITYSCTYVAFRKSFTVDYA